MQPALIVGLVVTATVVLLGVSIGALFIPGVLPERKIPGSESPPPDESDCWAIDELIDSRCFDCAKFGVMDDAKHLCTSAGNTKCYLTKNDCCNEGAADQLLCSTGVPEGGATCWVPKTVAGSAAKRDCWACDKFGNVENGVCTNPPDGVQQHCLATHMECCSDPSIESAHFCFFGSEPTSTTTPEPIWKPAVECRALPSRPPINGFDRAFDMEWTRVLSGDLWTELFINGKRTQVIKDYCNYQLPWSQFVNAAKGVPEFMNFIQLDELKYNMAAFLAHFITWTHGADLYRGSDEDCQWMLFGNCRFLEAGCGKQDICFQYCTLMNPCDDLGFDCMCRVTEIRRYPELTPTYHNRCGLPVTTNREYGAFAWYREGTQAAVDQMLYMPDLLEDNPITGAMAMLWKWAVYKDRYGYSPQDYMRLSGPTGRLGLAHTSRSIFGAAECGLGAGQLSKTEKYRIQIYRWLLLDVFRVEQPDNFTDSCAQFATDS